MIDRETQSKGCHYICLQIKITTTTAYFYNQLLWQYHISFDFSHNNESQSVIKRLGSRLTQSAIATGIRKTEQP